MKKRILVTTLFLLIAIVITGCGESPFDPDVTIEDPDLNGNVHFTLLQTTDIHHRAAGSGASATYSPTDGIDSSESTDLTTGGYARLATKISAIRNTKKNKNVLLVDSGDFLMGTVYDFSLGGSLPPLAFAFMEAMNYDAVTLGNHEFDFGPGPLYSFINKAMGAGGTSFNVPILESNMVTDMANGTDDDGIEALILSGVIKSYEIKTLDNGLKIGLIGIMGSDAETKAPFATPVTFINDLTDTAEISALQTIVTDLRAQVDIVIALSHSGVSNTDPTNPAGDDITLAQQVSGIDIIASGHDHEMTDSVIEITNGNHTTYIICAGHYGNNLAQLDVAYKVETGKISSVALTNNAINDSIKGDDITQTIVEMYEAGIDTAISPLSVNQVVGTTDSDNVGNSYHAAESGIGNVVADSLRYLGGLSTPTVGVVANGVVRNGFSADQVITFADLYSVLPLGMTLDQTQQNVPGYPLVQVYLTGAHIKNMCQLISYVIAAEDETFVSSLPVLQAAYTEAAASGTPAEMAQATQAAALCAGLQQVLPLLSTDYFLHVSGVQYTHAGSTGLYQVVPNSVNIYANTDVRCAGTPTPIDDATLYPVIVDIYVVSMMKDPLFITMLSSLGIPVEPTDSLGTTPVTTSNLMSFVITDSGNEVKEWQAFLTYLTTAEASLGLGGVIPDSAYGAAAINSGDSSRVNQP